MKTRRILLLLQACMLLTIASAQSVIDIQVKKTTATVNPDMYGIFFEDINYGADGGLYAELVKNRSFELFQKGLGKFCFSQQNVRF